MADDDLTKPLNGRNYKSRLIYPKGLLLEGKENGIK
jgi:hypothetical protein